MTIVMKTPSEDSVSKSEFKARALEYFRQVEKSRKPLTITDRGNPVLRLVPYSGSPEEIFRELRHSVIKYKDPIQPVGEGDWESLA